jgi:hypothetical protein
MAFQLLRKARRSWHHFEHEVALHAVDSSVESPTPAFNMLGNCNSSRQLNSSHHLTFSGGRAGWQGITLLLRVMVDEEAAMVRRTKASVPGERAEGRGLGGEQGFGRSRLGDGKTY